MARQSRRVAVLVDAAAAGQLAAADQLDSEHNGDVDAFFSDLGGESIVVQVHRRVEQGANAGRTAYVCKRPYTTNLLEDIQRDFGGGTYQLRAIDANSGKYVQNGTRTVVIDGPPVVGGGNPQYAGAVGREPGSDRLDRIERMIEALARPAVPATAPLDDLVKLGEVVKAFMPPTDNKSSDKMLDLYLQGRREGMEEARRFAQLTGGNGEGGGQELLQIGMPLIELAKQRFELDKAAAAAHVANPPSPAPQSQEVDANMVPLWYRMLKPHIPQLYERAKLGKTPEVYAAAAFEDLPDIALPQVEALVNDKDFPAQFLAAFPMFNETVELQQWVHAFIAELQACCAAQHSTDENEQAAAQ